MAKSPKAVFEAVVAHGLGYKQIRNGVLGTAFRGVKESIDELKLNPDAPTADPTLPGKVEKNTADIKLNTASIKALEDAPAPEGGVSQEDLAAATAPLPYRLETDKVLRKSKKQSKAAIGGEIQLVDNLGAYHNIVFKGENNIITTSDLQGIVIDGSDLMPRNLLLLPVLES